MYQNYKKCEKFLWQCVCVAELHRLVKDSPVGNCLVIISNNNFRKSRQFEFLCIIIFKML